MEYSLKYTICWVSFNTLKKIDMIWNVFPNHNGIELEINNKKNSEKSTSILKLSKYFYKLMGQKSHKKSRKHFECNDNENTANQKIGGAANTMLRGKFIAFNARIRKEVLKIMI